MQKATLIKISGALVLSLSMVGCGPPVLSQMKPTVTKTSVWVGLVDKPPGWNSDTLNQSLLSAGVIPQVQGVTSGQVSKALSDAITSVPSSLYVIAVNNLHNPQLLSVIASHPKQHFEIVAPEVMTMPQNVRIDGNSGAASGYVFGYLAGLAASGLQSPSVGIVTDGKAEATQAAIQAALIGVFTANSQLTIQPVNWNFGTTPGGVGNLPGGGTAAGQGLPGSGSATNATGTTNGVAGNTTGNASGTGNSTGPGNVTANGTGNQAQGLAPGNTAGTGNFAGTNVGSGTGFGTQPVFPRVIITTRALTSGEWSVVQQTGSLVVSLVADPGYQGPLLIGQPLTPSPSSLSGDVAKLVAGQWSAGAYTVQAVPNVQVETSALSAPSLTAFQGLLKTANPANLHLLQSWQTIPGPVRATLTQWVNQGDPVEKLTS